MFKEGLARVPGLYLHVDIAPSPLAGEGWGEGEAALVRADPLTPALSRKGRGECVPGVFGWRWGLR